MRKADKPAVRKSSWDGLLKRFNEINEMYAGLPYNAMLSAFANAGWLLTNEPHVQNNRVKAISSLPAAYSKDEIGEFLRKPYESEAPLRETAEILSWTAYPFFKIVKTYADIPTYHYYTKPLYLDPETAKTKDFLREATLIDKISKELDPAKTAHKVTGKAMKAGKVFYTLRYDIDKAHNAVKSIFLQPLPEDYCMIIGQNNISGYTVSFNLMYFLQPGTNIYAYGDLFSDTILGDFNDMFKEVERKRYIYMESGNGGYTVNCKGKEIKFYPDNLKKNAEGNPRIFMQNGQWMYWVSLPIDKVWVYEIDDSTPAAASPLAGLFLTYGQQSDYEATQLSLLMNPLIKIFTAEIPYYSNVPVSDEDAYMLSPGGRMMFERLFDELMASHNTSGTAFYSFPGKDIRSHDFAESANANDISASFNRYAGAKSGLAALIPVDDDIKAAQVEASKLIESRFSTVAIYPQFCRMMNLLYEKLNLKYEWSFEMFGTIFTDEKIRENAEKALSNGDISAHFVLSALDGQSWIDKLSMMRTIKESGLLDMLIPPITSYTMKQEANGGLPPQNETGRPKEDRTDMTDATEKAVDAGITEA